MMPPNAPATFSIPACNRAPGNGWIELGMNCEDPSTKAREMHFDNVTFTAR